MGTGFLKDHVASPRIIASCLKRMNASDHAVHKSFLHMELPFLCQSVNGGGMISVCLQAKKYLHVHRPDIKVFFFL